MRATTVKSPGHLIKAIDKLAEEGVFYSRSDAAREAARVLVDKYYNSGDALGRGKSAMVVVVARR
jgi:Arc/MetJ-type ribon-helix-helix transcriptional regulator